MFDSNMQESTVSEVQLQKIELLQVPNLFKIQCSNPIAFQRVLQYLYFASYSGEQDSTETVLDVLALADQYILLGLKRACEAILQSNVNKLNAVHILIHADK